MKALKLTAAILLVNVAFVFLGVTYVTEIKRAHKAGHDEGVRDALQFIAQLCQRGSDIVTIDGVTYACIKTARL